MTARHLTLYKVGYSGSALDPDYGGVTATFQFINVGGEAQSIKLKDIVPTGADPDDLDTAICMQGLDASGATDYSNTYDWEDGKWWCEGEDASEMTLPAGEAFFITSTVGDDANIQSAGEVNKASIYYPLDPDYGGVTAGNCFPVGIPLKNIVPTGADPDDLDTAICMQGLDASGATDYSNTYDWEDGKWWCEGEDASDHIIKPGEAFFITSTVGDEAQLLIPAPVLD